MDNIDRVKELFENGKVGFIGAGNMAQAICGGIIRKGLAPPSDIYVSAPSDRNLKWWKQQGVNTTHSNAEIVKSCRTVILAVKPQYLDDSLEEIWAEEVSVKDDRFVISVLAGVTISTLQEKLAKTVWCISTSIARVMPNTPMLVGAGCSAYCFDSTVNDGDRIIVHTMLSQLGMCVEVKENIMDAVSSISGCGPAFMYLLIEAMADGGVRMGVPRDMAQTLAAQTMLGAAQMVLQTGRHPGQLKDEVCSPGGSTIAGVNALEKHAVRAAMMAAVEASTIKNRELGKKKEVKTN